MFILCHPTKNEPRKRTKGSNTPWHPAKLFALAYLPLVVAKWRAMQNKHLCLSPKPSLQSGKGAVSKGGSLWLTFFRPFFVQRQRKDIKTGTAHARSCVRVRRNDP
jgi:hypothetical protein